MEREDLGRQRWNKQRDAKLDTILVEGWRTAMLLDNIHIKPN
jgi:hypothetical protein